MIFVFEHIACIQMQSFLILYNGNSENRGFDMYTLFAFDWPLRYKSLMIDQISFIWELDFKITITHMKYLNSTHTYKVILSAIKFEDMLIWIFETL